MKKTERKVRKSNRGFTLIEMIVTVAIIAVFGGVLSTLIGTGSNLFRGVSNNTKTQVNAQQVLDEMEDLIIDANRSVYYAYGTSEDMGAEITNDIEDSNALSKTFIACNEYENGDGTSRYVFDVMDWDGSEGKIYYSQRQYVKASSSQEDDNTEEQSTGEEAAVFSAEDTSQAAVFAADTQKAKDSQELIPKSVFAEGIESFGADVSKVQSDRIVRFRLTTDSGGKKVQTLHTVNLRNRIQVMKPDDAFADAQVTDVSISITNVPNAIDAGASWVFSYETKGNGDIDPTTLTWTVVDGKGSFPAADATYGKLTADTDATGNILIKVSVRTSDGKIIESAPVSVPVNNKRTITGIVPSKDTIVLAIGTSTFDLNSEILWKIQYSDGTEGNDRLDVTWNSDCSFASVSSDGKVTIPESAQARSTGSFKVYAANTAAGVSGEITVRIAWMDLTAPANGNSYQVGDNRELSYTYWEGGQIAGQRNGQTVEGVVPVITVLKHPDTIAGTSATYNGTGQFETQDIGDWAIQAQINLDTAGRGHGTVQADTVFSVHIATTSADIILNSNDVYDTVVAGQQYACSPTVDWGFNFMPEHSSEFWSENSVIKWSLKGNPVGVSIVPVNSAEELNELSGGKMTDVSWVSKGRSALITVDAANESSHPSGFILCADYISYTDSNHPQEVKRIHGEINIKVAYGLSLAGKSESNIVYYQEQYPLTLMMLYADENGTERTRKLSYTDNVFQTNSNWSTKSLGTTDNPTEKNLSANISSNNEDWYYTARDDKPEHRIKIQVNMWEATGVFFNDKEQQLSTSVTLLEKKHEYSVSVEAVDPSTNAQVTRFESGKNVKFIVHVSYDNVEIQDYQIDWNNQWTTKLQPDGHTCIWIPGQWDTNIYFQIVISTNDGKFSKHCEINLNSEFTFKFW